MEHFGPSAPQVLHVLHGSTNLQMSLAPLAMWLYSFRVVFFTHLHDETDTMSKPTLRRNGRHMITMSVKFHLSLDDLAYVIARRMELPEHTNNMKPEQIERFFTDAASVFTKKRLLQEARQEIYYVGGDNLWTVVEELFYGEQRVEAGRARVAELFPEMAEEG